MLGHLAGPKPNNMTKISHSLHFHSTTPGDRAIID